MKNVLFILVMVLISCSPARRLERICKYNPDICKQDTITLRDTLRFTDTIYISESNIDTGFIDTSNIIPGDTSKSSVLERYPIVIINYTKGHIHVSVWKRAKGSYGIKVTDMARDSIIERKIPYVVKIPGKKILIYPRWYQFFKYTSISFLIFLLSGFLFYLVKRISKKSNYGNYNIR